MIFSARKTILLWIMNTIVRPVTTHFWNISKRRMHIQDTDQQTPSAWVRKPEFIWHPVQRMRSKIGCFYFADIHHDSNSKCDSPQDSFLIDDSEYSSNQVNLCRESRPVIGQELPRNAVEKYFYWEFKWNLIEYCYISEFCGGSG